MPRGFDKQPSRRSETRRHPAAFGLFVDPKERAARPRATIWRVVGFLGAMVFAWLALQLIWPGLAACLMAPLVALVLFQLWYIWFEGVT